MASSGTTYKVALIGAGRIGAGFDAPDSAQVLSHAHSFSRNPRTKLVALVDTDKALGAREAARWGTAFYSDIDAMWEEHSPDIVVIATPDNTHADMLERVIQFAPKLVVYEKPACTNDDEAKRLRSLNSKIPVIVNFRRRFDPTIVALKGALESGEWGQVISVTSIYSKGLMHNGSHVIDLARYLFGEMKEGVALSSIKDWEGDETVGGFMSFEHCPQFHLAVGDERAYSIFELDILTEKKRFRFVDEGMRLFEQDVIADPVFQGYSILGKPREGETGLIKSMEHLAAHAVAVLDGVEGPRSTLENALKTYEACARFADKAKKT